MSDEGKKVTSIDSKIVGWRISETNATQLPQEEVKEEFKAIEFIPHEDVKKHRPLKLTGATYALKTSLMANKLYITINNITEDGITRPFELFFNSQDTNKFLELQIISRLISAIFRKNKDASFVIKELQAINNPDHSGYVRPPREGEDKGHYIPSIYYEIGEIIEYHISELSSIDIKRIPNINNITPVINSSLKKCPECGEKEVITESGCERCLSCGYSKCG